MQKKSDGYSQVFRSSYRDFWLSVVAGIFVLEFFITAAALCYAIISSPPQTPGEPFRLAFPWLGWLAAMVAAPALVLGLIHFATSKERDQLAENSEHVWESRLPPRMQHIYRLIKDAPLVVVSVACILVAATLLTIDGAFTLIENIARSLVPYLPYFIAAVAGFAVVIAVLMAWFRYKNNQLQAEYAFRREVLEKTGIILTDKNTQVLMPADADARAYTVAMLDGEGRPRRGLPPATDTVLDVSPPVDGQGKA